MAYTGKYIDRNPGIKSAGIPSIINTTTGETLKIYTTDEIAEGILITKCHEKTKETIMRPIPRGPFTEVDNITDLLSIETKKSRFVAFREKFSENMYFKKPELGKVFPLETKPEHITNENTTFGKELNRSENLYNLVLPKKTAEQVNREYIAWHDKYVLSHRHYLPAEQVNRNYVRPQFDPDDTFGNNSNMDRSGVQVKRCLTHCPRLLVISKAQKHYLERSMGRLGKKIVRHSLPNDMNFGKPTTINKCNVKTLIENINPCVLRTELIESVAHVTNVRRLLFERNDYQMFDLMSALISRDHEKSGYLALDQIFDTLRRELIRVNEKKMRTALKFYELIEDDGLPTERVNIESIWKLLHIQYPLPTTNSLYVNPANNHNKDTIYRDLCKDLSKREQAAEYTAIENAKYAIWQRKRDGDPTTAKDVISPDIPMQHGLVPEDFELPRTKEVLRSIFKRCLINEFDEVWENAKTKYQPVNDLLSINQLRAVMNDMR